METKDGSMGFDFEGTYLKVEKRQLIEYILADDRKVKIEFSGYANETHVAETFDPETENSPELQREGWQAILENFRKYAERNHLKL